MNFLKNKFFVITMLMVSLIFINGCGTGADARKYPPDPAKRIAKNMEEGKGFRIMDNIGKKSKGSAEFDFASSNELWRASLDTIDFMPLSSVNYSGGIIITDWYAADQSLSGESIKISIRFLTNEVRSDAIDIKVFYKKCSQYENCSISERTGKLVSELKKKILNKAAIYQKENKDKNYKPYKGKMKAS